MRPTIGVATIITSTRGMSAIPDCVAVNPSSSCMKSGRRNMLAISIANITEPMSVPEANVLSAKSRTSTAGAGPVDVALLRLRGRAVRGADVLGLVHEAPHHEEAERADRQVDEEDPRPVIVVDDVTSERGADGRPDHDGHREERHRHSLLLGREGLAQ